MVEEGVFLVIGRKCYIQTAMYCIVTVFRGHSHMLSFGAALWTVLLHSIFLQFLLVFVWVALGRGPVQSQTLSDSMAGYTSSGSGI